MFLWGRDATLNLNLGAAHHTGQVIARCLSVTLTILPTRLQLSRTSHALYCSIQLFSARRCSFGKRSHFALSLALLDHRALDETHRLGFLAEADPSIRRGATHSRLFLTLRNLLRGVILASDLLPRLEDICDCVVCQAAGLEYVTLERCLRRLLLHHEDPIITAVHR